MNIGVMQKMHQGIVMWLYNKEQEDELLFKAITKDAYSDGLEQGKKEGIEQTKSEMIKNK